MPTYGFKNKTNNEYFEKFMSWTQREEYLNQNPDIEPVVCAPQIVHERGTNLRVDDGFREVLSKIKSTHSINNIKDY